MKRILLILSIIISSVSLHAERYTIEVGQFQKLKINGNFSVIYKNVADSTGLAVYNAPAGNDDVFSFSTKGDGSLKVEPSDEKWGQENLPVLYLYSDFLTSIETYSEQTVNLSSLSPCATFNANLIGNGYLYIENVKCNNLTAAITTGNGSIYVSGSCINANFRMVGAGLISADQLKADTVKCRILGTGSIGCWPIDNLNVTGLGTTKIYYKGSPHIKKTGGGKLFELPDEMDEDAYSRLGTPVKTFNEPSDEDLKEDHGDSEVHDNDEDEDEDDDEDYQTIVTADD